MPDISGNYPTGFTIPAGQTWEVVGDTTIGTSGGPPANVIVEGTLKIRGSGNVSAPRTFTFLGIDDSTFVGGGTAVLSTDPGLWVMGGILDIVGTPITGWTRNPETAVGWTTPGTHVKMITPTGANDESVATTWNTGNPVPQAYPDVPPAEVFNLSRDILIQGTSGPGGTADPGRRAHIFIHPAGNTAPQVQTIKWCALRYMGPRKDFGGQQGVDVVLGRWPIHFHHGVEVHRGSIVEGVVSRDCTSHTYVVHDSHGVTFRDCVSYQDIMSPFWWDPREQTDDTLWEHCLAVETGHGPQGSFNAAFEMNFGFGNAAVDCCAVGTIGSSQTAGFKWSLDGAGPSGTEFAELSGSWVFEDNVAHNQKHGIGWWQNTQTGHVQTNFIAYNHRAQGTPQYGTGADIGAYRNPVRFVNPTFRNNPFEQHAAGHLANGFFDTPVVPQGITGGSLDASPYSLIFTGSLLPHHATAPPTLFDGVSMTSGILIDVTNFRRKIDILNCTINGDDVEYSDFTLLGGPGDFDQNYTVRVQRRDCTAFHFGVNPLFIPDADGFAQNPPVPHPDPGPWGPFPLPNETVAPCSPIPTGALVGAVTATVTAGSTLTPNFSSVPWVANDVALAFMSRALGAALLPPDPPPGWTRIWNLGSSVGATQRHSVLYGKVLAAGEDVTPIFDLPGGTGDATLILSVWRGVNVPDWEDVAETVTAGGNSANPTNPPITTVTDKAAVVVMGHITHDGLTAMGPPAGFASVASAFLQHANSLMAFQTKDPAGTVTPGPWTNVGGDATNDYTLVSYALRTEPAAPGGPIGLAVETSFAFPVTLAVSIGRANHFEVAFPVTLAAAALGLAQHLEEAFEVITVVDPPPPPIPGPVPVLTTAAILSSFAIRIEAGLELLDQNDLLLADISTNLLGGVVERNMNATIHGTARFQIAQAVNWHNQRLRPYLVATELITGAFERFDLGIYLPETPSRSARLSDTYDVEAYDKLVILDHPHGVAYTAAAGARVVTTVEAVLDGRGVTHALDQSSLATVPSTRSWPLDPQNTTLQIINDLLASINYRALYVDRTGIFRSELYRPPAERAPVWHYDASSPTTIIGEHITEEIDLFSIPNWWVFVRDDPAQPAPAEGNGMYTVINSSDGVSSIASRGRVITKVERLEAADHASLVALGNQIVQEDRQPFAHLEFSAVPNPLHWHADSVTVTSDELGLGNVVFGEQSWTLPLDGSDMTHQVRRSVKL